MRITSTAPLPFVVSRDHVRLRTIPSEPAVRQWETRDSGDRRRASRGDYVSASERYASSAEELDDEHDEREHEQEVDETTHCWQRHDAQQPEDEQDQDDGPEHWRGTSFT